VSSGTRRGGGEAPLEEKEKQKKMEALLDNKNAERRV